MEEMRPKSSAQETEACSYQVHCVRVRIYRFIILHPELIAGNEHAEVDLGVEGDASEAGDRKDGDGIQIDGRATRDTNFGGK